jgi:hypothetical protein
MVCKYSSNLRCSQKCKGRQADCGAARQGMNKDFGGQIRFPHKSKTPNAGSPCQAQLPVSRKSSFIAIHG